MNRARIPRRRGLVSSSEIHSEYQVDGHNSEAGGGMTQRLQSAIADRFTDCQGRGYICGHEAACRSFPNNTSKCVCPHDLSTPTEDLKCPVRLTVPLSPRPIHNIIPPTVNTTNSTIRIPTLDQMGKAESDRMYQLVLLWIVAVIVIVIIIIAVCVWSRRHYIKNSLNLSPINLKQAVLLSDKYVPNPQYYDYTPPEVPIISREHLQFLCDIGEGCFGKVYKGELTYDTTKEIVAVKVLKENATPEAQEDFLREVEIMSTFHHENILSLIGAVFKDSNQSPWMVFEYMPYGDLAQVLRSNANGNKSNTSGLEPLDRVSLFWISLQIASGMAYLSSQRFVHRDLACRNCLVGADMVVKIADFGMSRDVYTCDYYKVGGSRMLPVRWMSPESVVYGRFTLESDVWSYGVVLWEVYSFGKQPYFGHNNEEVVKFVLQGIQPTPPEECPHFMRQIMADCWKYEPQDRPTFSDILEVLEESRDIVILNEHVNFPRPPVGPVSVPNLDAIDPEGYLVPAPAERHEYMQPLPPIHYM